jgi:HPt (histidine-containing phosphotransfer) domain-containing protein
MNMKRSECVESSSCLNEAALLDSVGGDVDFLTELVGLFLAASPTLLCQIRGALAVNDFATIRRAARILKSLLRSFAVKQAEKAAEALETAACHGEPATAAEAFRALEKEIERLTSALSELEARRGHARLH